MTTEEKINPMGKEKMLPITAKDITFKEPNMNSTNSYYLEGAKINITKTNNLKTFKGIK